MHILITQQLTPGLSRQKRDFHSSLTDTGDSCESDCIRQKFRAFSGNSHIDIRIYMLYNRVAIKNTYNILCTGLVMHTASAYAYKNESKCTKIV